MHTDPRLSAPAASCAGQFLRKALAVAAGTIVLLVSLTFSVLVFACLLAVGLVVGTGIWWKTRHLRRELHSRAAAYAATASGHQGRTIEGEAIRDR